MRASYTSQERLRQWRRNDHTGENNRFHGVVAIERTATQPLWPEASHLRLDVTEYYYCTRTCSV